MTKADLLNRKVLSWACYDWANSAFALSVLAVLFPLTNQTFWNSGGSGADATARLAWITAASSVVVVVLAPVLGTIADAGGYRKRFLLILSIIGAASTAALGFVDAGAWPLALAFYLCASVGFYGSTVFYDSLLLDVTSPRYYSVVSNMAYAAGYLGGALLLSLHTWMIMTPQTFGLADATAAIRAAFVTVGLWWALFMMPILYFVPETKPAGKRTRNVIRAAYAELKQTIGQIQRYRTVVVFLVAYWLYIGGVFTVIFMAADYGRRLGFEQQDLVMALLVTNFAGFPATLLYGYFGHRFGPKRGIYFALATYIAMSCWAVFMKDVWQFFVMAVVIGCVQGGVQGLSRSLYASLIPEHRPGEFFGFYNTLTKFAHVLGPVLVAIAATLSDDPKWVLLSLVPLFIGGGMVLALVPTTSGETAGRSV